MHLIHIKNALQFINSLIIFLILINHRNYVNCSLNIKNTSSIGNVPKLQSPVNFLQINKPTKHDEKSLNKVPLKRIPRTATLVINDGNHNYTINITKDSITSLLPPKLTTITLPIKNNIKINKIEFNKTNNYQNVQHLIKNLNAQFKVLRNTELGVTKIQEIFDAMDFKVTLESSSEKLKKISNRLSKKLDKSLHIIAHLYDFFNRNISMKLSDYDDDFVLTDQIDEDNLDDAEIHKKLLDNMYLNTVIQPCPFQNYNFNLTINTKILDELRHFNIEANNIKNIFYLSRYDHASDYSCPYYFNDINYRYLFASAIKNKHLFLLIDHGNSFNTEQLGLSRSFVSNVVKMLSNSDTISIATIGGDIAKEMILDVIDDSPKSVKNHENFIYPTTMENKLKIFEFIENLNYTSKITNHSSGFQFAFELLKKQNFTENNPIIFVYLTRGLLSKLTDSKNVLTTIANGQKGLKFPIIINTVAVVLDEKRMMYEKQFLRDISLQSYNKFKINVTSWHNENNLNLTGNLFIVTKRFPERIVKACSALFENYFAKNHNVRYNYINNDIEFHLPIVDSNTKEVIISITRPVLPHGIIGLNLYLSDIAEDIIYFKNSANTYSFICNVNGIVLHHPAFIRPIAVTSNNYYYVDISLLENNIEFDKIIKPELLTKEIGNMTISETSYDITYHWRRVHNVYIVCIREKVINNLNLNHNNRSPINSNIRYQQHNEYLNYMELLYHRIDLIPPKSPVCRHFRQIATLESGTVFLSPSAFQSPFIYMKNSNKENIRTHTAQSIMAYIKDSTNLLANPGLLYQVRKDVSILYHVSQYLKKQHQENGPFRKYIIRRYVTTSNGVLQVYPGCILGTDLEPSRRPWYRKAMKFIGKIVVTEPYLDAAGSGYIITIAHSIFEGKPNALHSRSDKVIAIVAIDVPYAFFYKLILETSPFCSEQNIKCLLIEDMGYLMAHPSFMEPSTPVQNTHRPAVHLTHIESFVANDILNHRLLVQKKVCATYQNRTAQRYYAYNTSTSNIFTNVVTGDKTKYQITSIQDTNIFAAVLNSTCDGGAFCPCSTLDRMCLNCNRMDQIDCECPCECPLLISDEGKLYFYKNQTNQTQQENYDFCEPINEDLNVVNSLSYDWSTVIKPCININCETFLNQNDCLGVMGCEWCQLDIDLNPFPTAFCASQSSCFNGVLGSMTPYGDSDLGAVISEPSGPLPASAIGPVGGAVIALCIVVGFAMYCYRQNLDGSSDHLYPPESEDNAYGLPLSRFNFDDLTPHDESNSSNIMQKNSINPLAEVSPYHVSGISASYRRPHNNESDNGYSTMTPHEDSEHMCFALVEPLINNKHTESVDSMSISTSISSPNQNHKNLDILEKSYLKKYEELSPIHQFNQHNSPIHSTQLQTILPQKLSPHHILAQVTVHMPMEAS